MDADVFFVARRHRSPMGLIVVLYLAAAAAVGFGGWMMWAGRAGGVDLGWSLGLTLLIAGIGFGGDAGRRVAVNRVVDEILATLKAGVD